MAAGGSRRLWIVNGLVVLLVLLAVGGTVYGLTRTSSDADPGLRTTPLGRGTVAETVTASGTVTSSTSATLNFSSSGKIAEVRVRLGDRVTKGQTVAVLDGEYAQANLDAADAQVATAEQQLDDARYAKDHPQTQASTPPASNAGTMPAAGGGQPVAPAPTTTTPPVDPAARASTGQAQRQQVPAPQERSGGLLGNWSGSSQGVEAFPAQGGGSTNGGGAGGSTAGSSTAGTASTSGAGGQTGSTAQTSEDPGELAVRQAEQALATAKANRITAFQSTENLDLVAPQAGTVVSLDGVAGQLAGPQGIVTSSTATGNPAGGRLPDGSAISSGAGSGQSASSGSAAGAGASGAAASGAAASGGGGTGVTAAPTAPAVMTIADLASMQVLAQIPELDVGRVTGGQPVQVSVNALPGDRIPGAVSTVNVLPGSGATVQYGTAVAMTPPPLGLRPGMSASVAITVRQAPNVTFLPSVAVTPLGGPNSGAATVNVLAADGTVQPRQIGTGLSSDTVTQVTSGLSMGDLVVLPDPNTPNVFGQGGPPPNSNGNSGNGGGQGGGG
ncbi:efflux RND transporter periplasmic adaptor subunit [Actinomycetospora termitidis]|uniref:Efflux RND transporter periplasmic adaptor subunit n=1 Tax=Actinomycetospora termitidis TaxID=3053470 RepID=A0ABT7MAI0_9PSEU|nr:efflux RND transporter periplasmic adaptor subunit [Actinomycetospora sp. Odt1-22]MDL5157671.1 efflux RND transporter periplasmic adaptor subunit [Actinomycetospora sp. Odt1-22]